MTAETTAILLAIQEALVLIAYHVGEIRDDDSVREELGAVIDGVEEALEAIDGD